MHRMSNSRRQAGKAAHSVQECDVVCSGPSCVFTQWLIFIFLFYLIFGFVLFCAVSSQTFGVVKTQHRRRNNSFMCFSWMATATEVVTTLGWLLQGTCTAFASTVRTAGEMAGTDQCHLHRLCKICHSQVSPLVVWVWVQVGEGKVHLWHLRRLERSWAICSCMILQWLLTVLEVSHWTNVMKRTLSPLLWRAAPDVLHHCWMRSVPAKFGSHGPDSDSAMSGYWIVTSSHKEAQLAGGQWDASREHIFSKAIPCVEQCACCYFCATFSFIQTLSRVADPFFLCSDLSCGRFDSCFSKHDQTKAVILVNSDAAGKMQHILFICTGS